LDKECEFNTFYCKIDFTENHLPVKTSLILNVNVSRGKSIQNAGEMKLKNTDVLT